MKLTCVCLLLLGMGPAIAAADLVPTVAVASPGNAPDNTSYGAVAYEYRIGATEVSNSQYVQFLNAVAATDTFNLYNASMGSSSVGGIVRSGTAGTFSYAVKPPASGQGPGGADYTYDNKPVVFVSWYDTLRFANWLHNGQPAGIQNASTTEDGAYTFSSATSVGARNPQAEWWLTSENEWYKAAYFDASTGDYFDYPTGSNLAPDNNLPSADTGNSANFLDFGVGVTTGDASFPLTDAGAYTLSESPNDTYDQAGNVYEWNEALIGASDRVIRGGGWKDGYGIIMRSDSRYELDPTMENDKVGFRVATTAVAVPESSPLLFGAILLAAGLCQSFVSRLRFVSN